ncbi:Phage protein Gp37/Gp68 [Paraburkholderia hospita]|jgi:protein gp37|nr:Gp37Gp68 family protein [Burkholderia sp. BT03]SKC53930.1 Phage protein Gp37/Gp68 [Paraburkholderia hospita]SKD04699.1 Phage protein Gp37/Gp68 [Paraburkholderia hospita]
MSENSKIEWTDHTYTFNPWEGYQEVSPGCDNCYAETRNTRFAAGTAMTTNFRRASDDSAI